jgi:hypothetical protein
MCASHNGPPPATRERRARAVTEATGFAYRRCSVTSFANSAADMAVGQPE